MTAEEDDAIFQIVDRYGNYEEIGDTVRMAEALEQLRQIYGLSADANEGDILGAVADSHRAPKKVPTLFD